MFTRILLVALAVPSLLIAAAPPWWAERGVLDSSKAADDYSAANQGQVKHVASKAFDELQQHLPGGAGAAVAAMVSNWSSSQTGAEDFNGISVGQLKTVAKPFYDRLIAVGYVAAYPWTNGAQADDFAGANIGQVKHLFSFNVRADSDGDQLPDWWESRWFPSGSFAADNPDADDLTNLQEYQRGTNPIAADTDGDGFSDGDEVANGTSPIDPFDFGRLERSVWTGLPGTKVTDLTRTSAFAQAPTVRDYTSDGAIAPPNYGSGFGQRLRGTLRAPVTGLYTFWIASDDSGELWLGTAESRFSKRLVAAVNGHVAPNNWDASYSQKSVSVTLTAGERYWIEALSKEGDWSDHLAVAWQYPGQAREVIPARFLRPPSADQADTNDDNLPDSWAVAYELSNGEYGDLDRDGLSNFDEYCFGTNPNVAAGVPGYLSRNVWYGLYPSNLVTLTHDKRFLTGVPDRRDFSPGPVLPDDDRANDWGQRFRGTLKAPASGAYTFYAAADDNVELWLSTDGRKFQKKRIAWVEGLSYTGPNQFNKFLSQKSAPVVLVAGEQYYIEVLHTDVTGPEHIAIAWQKPGESDVAGIPTGILRSFVPDPDDVDDDDLPDSWEAQNSLLNRDGGQTDSRQGAFGDYDGDGLTNREEYLLGTKAYLADSDGDSVSDFDEVNGTHTDPTVQDLGGLTDAAVVTGSQATGGRLGQWITDGADIYAANRRGYVEYTLSVPNADVYRLEVEGRANEFAQNTNNFDLVLSVDGESLGHSTLTTSQTANGKVGAFTPWLTAGAHVVRIFWDNAASAKSLRIKFVRLQTISGADANGNGRKDWIETLLASRNGLTTPGAPIVSYVSPACIEGRGRYLSMTTLTASGGVIGNVAILPAPNDGWYANVPLTSNAVTALTVRAENGGITEARDIRWLPKNIIDGGDITVRKGDSLLLTAHPTGSGAPASGTSTITVGSTQSSTAPANPIPHLFSTVGTYTVSGSFSDGGTFISGAITVKVVEHSFTTNPLCWVGRPRPWDVTNLPSGVSLEADRRLQLTEVVPVTSSRRVQLQIDQNEPRHIVSRIDGSRLILSSTSAQGFRLFGAADTYNNVVERYSDGSRLVEVGLVLSPIVPNATLHVSMLAGGITFDDGTIVRDVSANDFDILGESKLRFLMPASAETANCHTISVTDDGVVVGIL
jgi:hypothetical protein